MPDYVTIQDSSGNTYIVSTSEYAKIESNPELAQNLHDFLQNEYNMNHVSPGPYTQNCPRVNTREFKELADKNLDVGSGYVEGQETDNSTSTNYYHESKISNFQVVFWVVVISLIMLIIIDHFSVFGQ